MKGKLRAYQYLPRPPLGCLRYLEPDSVEERTARYTIEQRGACTVYRLHKPSTIVPFKPAR